MGTLLAFLECLNVNGVSSSIQTNYLATLKAKSIIYGLPSVVFDDKKITLLCEIFEDKSTPVHIKM